MKKNLDFANLNIDLKDIQSTEKYYDESAYYTDCDVNFIAKFPIEDDYYLLFDKTVFFPEEGGQTPDKGTISIGYIEEDRYSYTLEVIDVHIQKHDGKEYILHRVKGEDFSEEVEKALLNSPCIHQSIDFDHRYSNMQNHTGEHIFSGIVKMKYGYENVGFHLSDNIVTMDYNGPLSDEAIKEIEYEVNYVIKEDFPVYCSYPTKEELEKLDYRSKIEIDGPVRIVTIPGIDTCACCAPHVYSTCEIGMFTVLSAENYKGGTRLSVLSGFRALSYTKNNQTVLEEISHTLKLPTEQLSFGVKKLLDDCNCYRRTISNLQASLLEMKCKNLPLDVANICIIIPETDSRVMRDCINDLKLKHTGYVMIINESAKQNSFIIGSNNKNCNELVQELKKSINIKGGGKPEMVQGSFDCDHDTITSLLKENDFEII